MDLGLMTDPSQPKRRCILVCQYRSCARNGAEAVLAAFREAVPPNVFVSSSDCMGQCSSGPTVRVMPDGSWYCRIQPSDIEAIVQQHLYADCPVETLLHPRFHPSIDAYNRTVD